MNSNANLLFYAENEETTYLPDNDCPISFPYQNLDTSECYSSLNNCIKKENNYFFNEYCYTNNCSSDKYKLSEQNNDIKNYFISKLSISDENIKNKLCICEIINGVWSNINIEGDLYHQKCLSGCEDGFEPEEITKLCVQKSETTIKAKESTAEKSTTVESIAEFKIEESTIEKGVNENDILFYFQFFFNFVKNMIYFIFFVSTENYFFCI